MKNKGSLDVGVLLISKVFFSSISIFHVSIFRVSVSVFHAKALFLYCLLTELPGLSRDEADKVATILRFAEDINNVKLIDFKVLVTDVNMRKYLGYSIPENKEKARKFNKKRKPRLRRAT